MKNHLAKQIGLFLLLIGMFILVSTTFATQNPVVWYKFDETSGANASDASGNGKNATLAGNPTWVAGKSGNAVNLSGSSQYLNLPVGIVSSLNDFTIATWVKLDTLNTWSRIFDFGTGAGTNMFLTPTSGSGIRFAITTGGAGSEQRISGSSALTANAWTHVAVTLAGNIGILYLNGQEIARNTTMTLRPSSLGNTTNNYIGRSQYADPYLDGQIDDFRIYDRSLTVAELQALMSGSTPTATATPTGTVTTLAPTPTGATPTPIPTGSTALPSAYLSPVFLNNTYKINSPFWNTRIKNTIVNWIPWCYNQLSNTSLAEGGIDNFVQAGNKLAGRSAKAHVGYVFANAYVLNTVEAICTALMVDPQGDTAISSAQSAMRAKLNDWIPKILAAQESDGYLQTYITIGNRARWSDRSAHEGYVAGYLIEAGIAHYLMTNRSDATLYTAAKRCADCWVNNIGSGKKIWWDGHQEMEQALTRLGRFVNLTEGAGQGDKYTQLAKFLLDSRTGGSTYDQSQTYPVNQTEAVGHAVRAVYMYTGMADVAMLTGNSNYSTAVNTLWDNLVNRKWYVTGGVGSGESSEGFGANYSLPNRSYCESCSGCGALFFNHKMNLLRKDAKYADLMETTLYNAILGSLDLNAKNFTYTNPLDQDSARYTWHNCPCCIGNIPRTLLSLPTWMYARGSDGLYVNQFIGSTVTIDNIAGVNVQMVQSTNYPNDGNVTLTINPSQAKNFTLYIRVPNRDVSTLYTSSPTANGFSSISVNGTTVTPTVSNGYAAINRTWSAGDTVRLALPLTVQRLKAVSNVTADRNCVALRYGPLVYNIESVDLNNDTNLNNYVLDPAAPLTAQWNSSLLGGVTVIQGTFSNGRTMTAIPNYARNNRGGRSIVWIREQSVAVLSPIAKSATPSSSYCSSWESVLALNDQIEPVNSQDRSSYVYGNWDHTTQEWIQYDFDKSYTISSTGIYWFSDGGGIQAPGSWYLTYWNGSTWVNVANPSGYGVALNRWNNCTFTAVTTNRVRLYINPGAASTGAVEWKIQ